MYMLAWIGAILLPTLRGIRVHGGSRLLLMLPLGIVRWRLRSDWLCVSSRETVLANEVNLVPITLSPALGRVQFIMTLYVLPPGARTATHQGYIVIQVLAMSPADLAIQFPVLIGRGTLSTCFCSASTRGALVLAFTIGLRGRRLGRFLLNNRRFLFVVRRHAHTPLGDSSLSCSTAFFALLFSAIPLFLLTVLPGF